MNLNKVNSDAQRYKRNPAKRVLIGDLYEGQWLPDENLLASRYGKIKTVRICGTVTQKKEVTKENVEESFISNTSNDNTRIFFQIDDGTGRLNCTLWGVKFEDYSKITYGTLVDIVGNTRSYQDKINLNLKFIRKIENPNDELHHILEVLKRRKLEPTFEIEKITPINFNDFDFESKDEDKSEDFPEKIIEEIKINEKSGRKKKIEPSDEKSKPDSDLFKGLDQMDEIVIYIQENDKGDGVSIEEIGKIFSINMAEIKKIIDQLCQDVKIYKVHPGFYSSY
ncbi:OB-fold nucleic acid binding domain-containing protein [Promethearchaeum syntrophicum]|uniref:CST complex subunit STN1 n=1 Tax=Promethearchaeum syntrophicum TaxID=2594042 RepID=A0A5B9D7K0_9ARCH|nr:OB-fold nucleic acid binding domain-containing protein [Candidatus Prometheoarchaeum syntrophicum]QEE14837.1 OB-fold nucleic acid binding domain protein [Candidatus Prometheoarchaeum syntrophicum]